MLETTFTSIMIKFEGTGQIDAQPGRRRKRVKNAIKEEVAGRGSSGGIK